MSDPFFATEEEELAAGLSPSDVDGMFASEDEEIAAGLSVERTAPVIDESRREVTSEGIPDSLKPGGELPEIIPGAGSSDFLQGIGNAMNLQTGMARVGNALGLIDDADAKRLLEVIERDQSARRKRGHAYGAGELVGNTGAAALLAPLGGPGLAGAARAGAVEGGLSELARTGKMDDAVVGTVTGAAGGAAGHGVASALGKGASALRRKLPAGDYAERLGEAARREAADLSALSRQDVPAPDVAGQTLDGLMSQLSESAPDVAAMAAKSPGVARRAASAGELGPRAMRDLAAARALRSTKGPRDLKATDAALWSGATAADAVGSAAVPMSIGASSTYSGALSGMMSMEPDPVAMRGYETMAQAAHDPALDGYPGLHSDLTSMLSEWSAGKRPPPDVVSQMEFRLHNVPGMMWTSIEREEEEDE